MLSRRPLDLIACIAMTATAFMGTFASAEDGQDFLKLSLDHARVLKLDRSVSKVIVGNDQIADATVADAKTIILTGKSFGTTNLVLLDADGNAIVDENVLVTLDEAKTIRVYRQTDRDVLSCAPNCEVKKIGGNSTSTSAASATAATGG